MPVDVFHNKAEISLLSEVNIFNCVDVFLCYWIKKQQQMCKIIMNQRKLVAFGMKGGIHFLEFFLVAVAPFSRK